MRVLIIGPGRIGCGLLAPLFTRAGCTVVVAARSPDVAVRIASHRRYQVRVVAPSKAPAGGTDDAPAPDRTERVELAGAVVTGSDAFTRAVAEADLIVTAVKPDNVRSLAQPLAASLSRRNADGQTEVWCVENGDCAPVLEEETWRAALRTGEELPPVTFAGAVAAAAVSHGSWRQGSHVEFVGDDERTLLVDSKSVLAGALELPGVESTDHYLPRLREKLYVLNSAHAICAYLGWLRGHGTIDQAVVDPFLRPIIVGCLLESRRAILGAHPELGSDVHGPVANALGRFSNRRLADPVVRVARDPLRKLSPGDRLLGPAELVLESTGSVPAYFALGIAAALVYRNREDVQARRLQAMLARQGVMAVLDEVCRLKPYDALANAIATRYRGFIFTPEGTLFPPAGPDGSIADLAAKEAAGAFR